MDVGELVHVGEQCHYLFDEGNISGFLHGRVLGGGLLALVHVAAGQDGGPRGLGRMNAADHHSLPDLQIAQEGR